MATKENESLVKAAMTGLRERAFAVVSRLRERAERAGAGAGAGAGGETVVKAEANEVDLEEPLLRGGRVGRQGKKQRKGLKEILDISSPFDEERPSSQQHKRGDTTPAASTSARDVAEKETKITFDVEGMYCNECADTVGDAIRKFEFVKTVKVTLFPGTVTIYGGDQVGSEVAINQIKDAIVQSGFQAGYKDVQSRKLEIDSPRPNEKIPKSNSSKDSSLVKLLIKVEGMSCSECANSLETIIMKLPGVVIAAVSVLTGEAMVEFQVGRVSVDSIVKAVSEAGFQATILEVIIDEEEEEKDKHVAIELKVFGMTCSSCSSAVENALMQVKGVQMATVNAMTGGALVKYSQGMTGPREIIEAIDSAGFEAEIASSDSHKSGSSGGNIEDWKRKLLSSLILCLPVFVLLPILMHLISPLGKIMSNTLIFGFPLIACLQLVFATPIQFWVGSRFYIGAWHALRNYRANMDVLVVLGTTTAYLFSAIEMIRYRTMGGNLDIFFDSSALLVTFICLGKYLESSAKAQTSNAISKLMQLAPDTAILVELDDLGQVKEEQEILTTLIHVGDCLKILPGAKIPTDGTVRSGSSYIDESMITGESLPVLKCEGDTVIGGTVNTAGLLHMTATKVGSDTALAQIIKMVETAQMSKAPVQRYADKISSYFVPIVIILSVATFLAWYISGDLGSYPSQWIPQGHNLFLFSLTFGISVVVVACPCALGLATPTAIMVGTGVGATNGVLIKGGDALEKACSVCCLVFDKTGTLTVGLPCVVDTFRTHPSISKEECAVLAATVESSSEHPLAKAIVRHAYELLSGSVSPSREDHGGGQQVPFGTPEDVDIRPGFGITCTVKRASHLNFMRSHNLSSELKPAQDMRVCIGNRKLMQQENLAVSESTDLWMNLGCW